ncbi:MAG: hypothetical protein K2I46_04840 [Clostridia bacterium]|nr:hypothetical protein [Clostridia bacterium]
MDDKEFKYTYSAPTAEEKKEILKIQSQYLPKERDVKEESVAQLKKLDTKVKTPAKVIASVIGVIGFCCFGVGMSMALEWQITLWGAILGIIGLILMAVAYPIFNKILARRKKKYAEQILALSHSLLNENNEENVSLDIKQVVNNKDEE